MDNILELPLTDEMKEFIFAGFSQHAISIMGQDGKNEPVTFVSMDHEKLEGVLVVEKFWDALHIKYLFVNEQYRKKGVGSTLMKKAFDYGLAQGCPFAFVETMSFQATGFYRKLGFELEFTRSGYSHGTEIHYMRKVF